MSELIQAVRAKSDVVRVTVVTRAFEMEGSLHCPRLGKEGRRLSNLLNSKDRHFLALTDVQMVNRQDGSRDPKTYPLIQISVAAVEYLCPYLDEAEAEQESLEPVQDSIS